MVTFTIRAHNNGPDEVAGLQITDVLPNGLNFRSYTTNGIGIYNSTTGIWNIGFLANGADAILKITANVTTTGTIISWANVTAQTTSDALPWSKVNTTVIVPETSIITMNKEFRATLDGNAISSAYYLDNVYAVFTATNTGPDRGTFKFDDISQGFEILGTQFWYKVNSKTWNVQILPLSGVAFNIGPEETFTMALIGQINITGLINSTASQIYQNTTNITTFASASKSIIANPAPTSLTIGPASGYKDDNTTLTAKLWDTAHNMAVADKSVSFYINNVLQGSSVTNSTGYATWTYNILQNIGTYSGLISVEFTTDNQYNASNGTNALTVNATPTSLTVASAYGYKDYNTTLNATLWDTFHNVTINGKTVDFWVNNVKVGSGTTDANGIATYVYAITENVGTYINYLMASFDADDKYAEITSAASNLTVTAIPTRLTVDNTEGYKGDAITLRAVLSDMVHSEPIANKIIQFGVAGHLIGSNTTDSNGLATFIYTISKNVGMHTLEAVFTADDKYEQAYDLEWLTVKPKPTNLTINNITSNKGKTVNLTATLTDKAHNNTPISGKTIIFKVNGNIVGNETTDSNGIASYTYLIDLVGGNYTINSIFTADNQYTSATGNGTLKINQSSVYTITTVSKKNPTVAETIKLNFKLGNKGPDPAEDVLFTYQVPEGMEFVSLETEPGYPAAIYDPATRTVTWTLGTVPILDPWLKINVKVLKSGTFNINPTVTTSTYDPNLASSIQFITINAVEPVKAKSSTTKTIGMQKTGLPIAGLILALLALFGGLLITRRK